MAHVSLAADFVSTTIEADWPDLFRGSIEYVSPTEARLVYVDSFGGLTAPIYGVFGADPSSGIVTAFDYGGLSMSGLSIAYSDFRTLALQGSVPTLLKVVLAGNDVVEGSYGSESLSGYGGDDRLFGYDGNDRLDGGRGVDHLVGGRGDDLYIVRDATDYVYENAGEGTDRVISDISYALRPNVELLSLSGTADISGRGNDLDNVIVGNSGANHLYGGGGDDKLSGRSGNDVIDGGAGNDRLYGGDGNDVLQGASGNDLMVGGAGNDTYYVDSPNDTVVEINGQGRDTVFTTVDLTLAANVENGRVVGDAGVSLTGNDLGNVLYGGGGDDLLWGGAGADVLVGGTGQDTLVGDLGNDTFTFMSVLDSPVSRPDLIVDYVGDSSRSADFSYDIIDLSAIDANTAIDGDQAFNDNVTGTPVANGLWVSNVTLSGVGDYADELLCGDVNGDAVADFAIEIQTGAFDFLQIVA